jgi:hypothetical protein
VRALKRGAGILVTEHGQSMGSVEESRALGPANGLNVLPMHLAHRSSVKRVGKPFHIVTTSYIEPHKISGIVQGLMWRTT